MSRLEEIKNNYLKSLGYDNYQHLVNDVKSRPSLVEKLILLEDDISEKYATECVKASLEKASENIKMIDDIDTPHWIDKKSITNPENIVLL